MLKKYFIMAITAIFALVACSEKFDEPGMLPAGSDNVHTLSVGIEAGTYTPAEGETKASMEAVIRVNWTKNDEVSVVNATTGKILGGCLKAKESGTSVTFEGTVTGTINQNDKLYYIYPRIAQNESAVDFDNSGYGVSLAGQTYDGDNPGKVSFFGYAEDVATTATATISKKIQFHLVTAYAHLNMSNLPAKGAPLTSIDISNVNEGFTWKLSSEKILSAEPYAGNNGISVTCTNNNITPSGNAVVRFALPASGASQQAREITVNKAYKNDGYTVKELEKASYHNQLYSTWENNVKVTSQGDKTKVDITTSEGSTDVAEGVIPVADAFVANKETEIGIGGVGTVTFDATATAKIKRNADDEGSTNVFFKVEDVTKTKPVQDANLVYEVTMKTVDEKGVEVFSTEKAEGVATVTVPLGEQVEDVTKVALVDEQTGQEIPGGVVEDAEGKTHTFANGILTFQVNHFSKYAIQYTVNSGEVTYVARIGSSKYTSLANAIAAAQNGNTIQMIADFATTDNVTVDVDKNIVLDLNGKTIGYTTNGCGAFITNCGYLKITDSSNGKNGKITACHNPNWMDGCYTIDNSGQPSNYDKASTLIIEAGTIENTSPQGLAWPVNNGSWGTKAKLIINGGTIHSVNYVPVREYLQCGGKKTIVINGGKFISDNSRAIAVQVSDATIQDTGSSVTINGGEFTCNGSGILYIDLHAANVDMTGFTMTVNGGKFKNSNTSVDVLVYDDEGNTQTSAVLLSNILKGGIYSKEPAPKLIPFGYHIEENTDAQTSSAYPWRVAANPATNAEVSVSKPGQTTVYSTLAAFRDETNAGNTFAGYTITLLKDIDLKNEEWTPISNYAYGHGSGKIFAGTFDGDNHTISNLKISSCNQDVLGNTENIARGFFGQVATCTIKNLKFSNANVSSDAGLNAVVASLHTVSTGKLIMDNVQVLSGSVSCSTENAGGLMAFCTGWSEFTNCVNHASVTGYGVGGIVGILRDNAGVNTCVISDCINYGAITNTVGGGDGAGGIVSKIQDYGTISGCKNYGEIKGTVGNVYAAGIIGIANCGNSKPINITDCVNYASITSDAGDYGRAGGIVAKWSGSYTISHCINSGNITGYQGAGGIVGWSGDSWGLIVKYSYNSGSVTTSHGNSGGIDQGEANQTISYSLNSGSVSCAEGKKAEQISNSSSTISSCYYYDGDTLKDKDGTEVNDVDAALASLNIGLSTPFWRKDGNTIKPIAIIKK